MYFSILWHHHQPIYRHPESGQYLLSYVNYHLVRNYYQMAYLAEEQGFPCVFNLVPCLLEQIEEYIQGKANDPLQMALEKNPENLAENELARLRRFLPPGEGALSPAELQRRVLGSMFSPVIGKNVLAHADKESLLGQQKELGKKVIPLYQKLWLEGCIELTTSAYYHPLLPLLVNLSVANEPVMPRLSFRYPEDARWQIDKGREYFQQIFNRPPEGFWPSEGGISSEVAQLVAEAGFFYAVTDENILWKSLGKAPDLSLMAQAYSCQALTIFFRDRELSDLISFCYQSWETKEAVSHFEAKIKERMKVLPEQAIAVIALDGENPWAGYPDNGVPFLREFYSRLRKIEGLTPILLHEYQRLFPSRPEIELAPGTWLGNFSRWVGHPAKSAAWEKLAEVREEYGQQEEVLVAEGSDWFWWFGEPNVNEFTTLFEAYLGQARKKNRRGRILA